MALFGAWIGNGEGRFAGAAPCGRSGRVIVRFALRRGGSQTRPVVPPWQVGAVRGGFLFWKRKPPRAPPEKHQGTLSMGFPGPSTTTKGGGLRSPSPWNPPQAVPFQVYGLRPALRSRPPGTERRGGHRPPLRFYFFSEMGRAQGPGVEKGRQVVLLIAQFCQMKGSRNFSNIFIGV